MFLLILIVVSICFLSPTLFLYKTASVLQSNLQFFEKISQRIVFNKRKSLKNLDVCNNLIVLGEFWRCRTRRISYQEFQGLHIICTVDVTVRTKQPTTLVGEALALEVKGLLFRSGQTVHSFFGKWHLYRIFFIKWPPSWRSFNYYNPMIKCDSFNNL